MGRVDWKMGRFTATFETHEIHEALRGWQSTTGDEIQYYRYAYQLSTAHDVYDEGAGSGRIYIGPMVVPVLHVLHHEDGNQDTPQGFYTSDDLQVTCSYRQLARAGLDHADIQTGLYLRDRIVYDDKLFSVTRMAVEGQVQRRDVIVQISCVQLKADEAVNDPQFVRWTRDPMALENQVVDPLGDFGSGAFGRGFFGA